MSPTATTTPTRRRRCSAKGCREQTVARKLCSRHYQAAWKAGDFTNAPLRPRSRDRKICPPDHKHAEVTTCYIQHQCRCDPCMDDHKAREQRRKKLKAYGRFDTGLVDAEPVRQHLLQLATFGLGYKRVAHISGVHISGVRVVLWGRQEPGPRYGELPRRIGREKAERILAVQPLLENLAGGAALPARGTIRRIQSLIAFGWSQAHIAREIGWNDRNLSGLRRRYELACLRGRGSTIHVNASTARAVIDLYNRLSITPPPQQTHHEKSSVSRARNMGREHGWPLPMDWEAYDNDFDRAKAPRRSA